jgi:hypothetical protein
MVSTAKRLLQGAFFEIKSLGYFLCTRKESMSPTGEKVPQKKRMDYLAASRLKSVH